LEGIKVVFGFLLIKKQILFIFRVKTHLDPLQIFDGTILFLRKIKLKSNVWHFHTKNKLVSLLYRIRDFPSIEMSWNNLSFIWLNWFVEIRGGLKWVFTLIFIFGKMYSYVFKFYVCNRVIP
jgi:hypothetical protein